MSLLDGPISALVAAVQSGETTAAAMTADSLARAEARNPAVNAISQIYPPAPAAADPA